MYGATNSKIFFVYIVCYLSFAFFAYHIWNRQIIIEPRARPVLFVSLLVLLFGYLSAYVGVSLQASLWSEIFRSAGLLFLTHIPLTAFVWSEMLEKQDWVFLRRVVIVASAVFSFLYSFGSFGFQLLETKVGFINFGANGLTIGNETFAGIFVTIAIVFTLFEYLHARTTNQPKILPWVYGALVVQFLSPLMIGFPLYTPELNSINSVIGDARSSALVAWAILGLFIFVRLLKRLGYEFIVRYLYTAIIAMLVFMVGGLFVSGSFVQERYIELSGPARVMIWESSLASMDQNKILFGYGPENFNDAVQENIDNNLYLDQNGAEVWFDKAHNVIVESFVTRGVVGLVLSILLFVYILRVLYVANLRGHLSRDELHLWYMLFIGHVVQVMTGFDTAVSYMLWIFVFAYVMWLEKHSLSTAVWKIVPVRAFNRGLVVLFGGILIGSFVFVYIPEHRRQTSIVEIFTTPAYEERLQIIEDMSTRRASLEQIRLLSSGLVVGIFEGENARDEVLRQRTVVELGYYDGMLVRFIEENPYNYRARVNLAYIRFAQAFLGNNRLIETASVFDGLETISNDVNPLTPIMKGLYNFYIGNIEEAQRLVSSAIEMNPDIEFTHGVQEYMEAQIVRLPRVVFLKLENL